MRYGMHLLLLLALLLPRHGFRTFRTRHPVLQTLRGVCMFGMPAAFLLAAGHARIEWIWTVFWTMPGLVLAGSALTGKYVPPIAWVSVAAGLLGTAAIMGPERGGSILGTGAALLMAACLAAYLVLSRLLRHDGLRAGLVYTALGALLPMSVIAWRVWTPISITDLLPALILGFLSIATLACLDLASAAGPLWIVAPVMPLVNVWQLGFTNVFAPRPVQPLDLLGAALIATAVPLLILHAVRSPAPATASTDL